MCIGRDDIDPVYTPRAIDLRLRQIQSKRIETGKSDVQTRLPWTFDFAQLHIRAFEDLEHKRKEQPWERLSLFDDISEVHDVYRMDTSLPTLTTPRFHANFTPSGLSGSWADFDDSEMSEHKKSGSVDAQYLNLVAKELHLTLIQE